MQQNSLFKIDYWKISVVDFKIKKQQLIDLLKEYPEKKQGIQFFSTNKQNNRDKLSEKFFNIFSEEFKQFSNNIKKNIILEDVWSVSYNLGDYHIPHNHGVKGLSGILYLELNEKSPSTCFLQPWNDIEKDESTIFNMPVKEGEIIIFPSFVNHFSLPNKYKKIKRIVSFDMKIRTII